MVGVCLFSTLWGKREYPESLKDLEALGLVHFSGGPLIDGDNRQLLKRDKSWADLVLILATTGSHKRIQQCSSWSYALQLSLA